MNTNVARARMNHPVTTTAPGQFLSGFDVPELQRTLKLAGLLQTSLELENILQYFVESVQEAIPIDGLAYDNCSLDVQFHVGKPGRHRCVYPLTLAGDTLGEITFSRNQRFSDQEMEQLENFTYQLVYPLRNAILYQEAVHAAQIDGLTGANNRAAMDRCLERELELAHRHDHALSLILVDVDHFKRINDLFGHSAGDAVLKDLTTRMKATMRASDMLFRYGGEEFALVLMGTELEGAYPTGERLRAAIAASPFFYSNREIDVTVSIGIACLGPRDDANQLFNKADAALYQAKKAGRNQVRTHTENDSQRR